MLNQKSLFFFLSTTLLVTLTSESSSAFSITQNRSLFDYQAYSVFIGEGQGFTTLNAADPLDPSSLIKSLPFVTPITLGGTAGLLADLQLYRDEGWTFKQGRDLQGRFDVQRQYACGNLSLCGLGMREIPDRSTVGVTGIGSLLEFNYIPRTDLIIPDPQPSTANLHWIQRVVTNYPAYAFQGKPGTRTSYIDNLDGLGQSALYPYFATGRKVDATGYFGDRPYRPFKIDPKDGSGNLFRNYYWYAELYLAEADKLNPFDITIYNGVRWGWQYKYFPFQFSKTFSGTLANGYQTDNYKLDELTPGSKYTAWTNNDLPSNRCNPNTRLTASSPGGSIAYDDNSSPVGNGFASGLTGTVGTSGTINLSVGSTGGGARGQDKGNYELFVNVYDPGESPTFSNGNSGGGGFGKEMRGLTQQNPILPTSIQNGWQTFSKVPGCRWYDPHTTYGFEFQSLEDTLFTEILDFPVGEDTEFAVTVGNVLLGTFGPGSSIDFVSLIGHPVNNFKITGINSLFGSTAETAFPIQLAFDKPEGSFKMREFYEDDTEGVPEPATVLGTLLALGGLGKIKNFKNRK